jgi:lysyl-tRNA synthetase class 2
MSWQPRAALATARARATMLEETRRWFGDRQVLEVCTPALGSATTTDPQIDSIHVRTGDRSSYLQTSPEHFMKRLLAAGYPDIYQLCPVFRGGESGRLHLAEFTMIEWYRRDFSLPDIMQDSVQLATTLLDARSLDAPLYLGYAQAFQHALATDPHSATAAEIADALYADPDLRRSLGDDRDAWLDLAMATAVAPSFADNRLTVVHHYPASQASLARICPDDQRLADRFELYLGAIELANGFVELTDADEQLRRFEADRARRSASGRDVPAVDEDLILALRAGLPACAGVAMGLDRLLMINEGLDDIRACSTFVPGD